MKTTLQYTSIHLITKLFFDTPDGGFYLIIQHIVNVYLYT